MHSPWQEAEIGGLHLVDFEQLKMENGALREKIEERACAIRDHDRQLRPAIQVLCLLLASILRSIYMHFNDCGHWSCGFLDVHLANNHHLCNNERESEMHVHLQGKYSLKPSELSEPRC